MTSESAAKKDIQKLQRAIVEGLEDVKGQDIVVFNTEELSPLFERVIIASGTSNRQTKALAASVRDAVREAGFDKPRVEGEDNGEWIIVDCGQAVAHVMQPAIRQYYRLEEIWGVKPVRLKGPAEKAAARKAAPAKKPARSEPAEPVAATRPARKAPARSATGKAPSGKPAASKTAPARKTAAKAAPAKAAPARRAASAGTAAGKPAASRSSGRTAAARKPAAKPRAALPKVVVGASGTKKKTTAKPAAKAAAKKPARPATKKKA
ncbi:ribosome silencing factor [Hydrogenophaga sp. XSHU_21]